MSNVIFIRQQSDGNPPTYDSLFYKDNSTIAARDYRPLPTLTNNFYTANDLQNSPIHAQYLRPNPINITGNHIYPHSYMNSNSLTTRVQPRRNYGCGACACTMIIFFCIVILLLIIFASGTL